jgi:CHASE2 domain-containing sensor protein
MEPIDVIILIAAVSVVGGVIAWAIKRKKQGKGICCDCSSCSGNCAACCAAKTKTVENE